MKYEEVKALRKELIALFSNSDVQDRDKQKKKLIHIINGITGLYKFITIYDFEKKKFVFHHGVLQNTGYEHAEFTIEAINNAENATPHIIHPDDIEHKLRYDLVMYKLLAEGVRITSLADSYEISFRIILKNRTVKSVRRQTFIFETNTNGTPITQLDIWEILNDLNPYVKIQLNYTGNGVTKRFYQINRELLNFQISLKEIQIIKFRKERLDNKQIADKLGVSVKTIENYIRNLKLKIQDFYTLKNIDDKITNMNDIIHFIKIYGIFSFTSPAY